MLKKRCSLILKTTKKITSILILFGSLLFTAGLFLYFKNNILNPTSTLKPSQLDFSDSNQFKKKIELNTTKELQINQNGSKKTIDSENISQAKNSIIQLSEHEKSTWQAFEDILHSKNDNDARINQELRSLSSKFHEALYEKYNSISAENRNGKGFIVFLISRDLKSKEDIEFLTKIYQEGPCLSLEDCKNAGSDDAHHAGTNQTTLVYPQFAGLYQIENKLSSHPEILNNSVLRHGIIALLQRAEDFPVPAIQQKAQDLRRKFNL